MDDRTSPPAADQLDRMMKPRTQLGFEAHARYFIKTVLLDTSNLLYYSD
jgi:hypothetical protein